MPDESRDPELEWVRRSAGVADLPTLFTIFDRLGLKMVQQKGNVDVYVIDRIEKPAEN